MRTPRILLLLLAARSRREQLSISPPALQALHPSAARSAAISGTVHQRGVHAGRQRPAQRLQRRQSNRPGPVFKPLGIEALITDAGWFRGGWPSGESDAHPAKYPRGMTPVAAAAKRGKPSTVCGRVRAGMLRNATVSQPSTMVARRPRRVDKTGDFGLPEVRADFLALLDDYFRIPGFLVYRQDLQREDAPLLGRPRTLLIARASPDEVRFCRPVRFWDAIRQKYPGAFLEGPAKARGPTWRRSCGSTRIKSPSATTKIRQLRRS